MQGTSAHATEQALDQYRTIVRHCLACMHGYECQEADGEFMLAFHCGAHAANFCLMARPSSALHLSICCRALELHDGGPSAKLFAVHMPHFAHPNAG